MTGRTHVLVPAHVATETSAPVAGGTGWLLGDAGQLRPRVPASISSSCAGSSWQPRTTSWSPLQWTGRPDAAQVPGAAAGRDQQARRDRRSAPWDQTRPAPYRPVLRHSVAGQRQGGGALRCNRFSVTRQLRYSRDETQRALDLALFINGLPIATFELKNSLTKQTVDDAIEQYKRDRDPREKLFEFGRCMVHFAVDEHEVRFCTHLKGKGSWFLPFNLGWNDGAGNPPNPDGLKTDYLWKRILTPRGSDRHPGKLRADRRDARTRKPARRRPPRSGRATTNSTSCADCSPMPQHGAGERYLIQHSAGSGKSNSIAWLAHQLIGLAEGRCADLRLDHRRHRPANPRPANPRHHQAVCAGRRHRRPRRALWRSAEVHRERKKIIISTVQKFPFILDDIGSEHRGRRFAIIIDEAHSSQGGQDLGCAISMALRQRAPRRTTRPRRTRSTA